MFYRKFIQILWFVGLCLFAGVLGGHPNRVRAERRNKWKNEEFVRGYVNRLRIRLVRSKPVKFWKHEQGWSNKLPERGPYGNSSQSVTLHDGKVVLYETVFGIGCFYSTQKYWFHSGGQVFYVFLQSGEAGLREETEIFFFEGKIFGAYARVWRMQGPEDPSSLFDASLMLSVSVKNASLTSLHKHRNELIPPLELKRLLASESIESKPSKCAGKLRRAGGLFADIGYRRFITGLPAKKQVELLGVFPVQAYRSIAPCRVRKVQGGWLKMERFHPLQPQGRQSFRYMDKRQGDPLVSLNLQQQKRCLQPIGLAYRIRTQHQGNILEGWLSQKYLEKPPRCEVLQKWYPQNE